jgi:biotin transporter BioY
LVPAGKDQGKITNGNARATTSTAYSACAATTYFLLGGSGSQFLAAPQAGFSLIFCINAMAVAHQSRRFRKNETGGFDRPISRS